MAKRTIGVNFDDSPHARIWAPHARTLSLEVEGESSIPLQKAPMGFWEARCPGLKPGDRYMFRINDKKTFPDPTSLSQPEGVHRPSECIDLNAIKKIHDPSWKGIAQKDLIIYEVHTATFTPQGTFAGISQKLDYLKSLGVNAIKILPVAAFPGSRNWGYDGVYPFAVQQSYGGAMEFAQLIKSCHGKGIAVILDVVYNHLGPEGNYFGEFGPFFTSKYTTPWGKAINFDDAWCDGVRNFVIENALMWLRDFHVDGLRLDAVHAIRDFGPKHILSELSDQVAALNKEKDFNHFLIAECDLNDTRYINPVQNDGYGMDAQWCDEWHHSLHALVTGEKNGYYHDFGPVEKLVRSFNNGYVFTGQYSEHRKKIFGTPTGKQPGERFVVFTQNHDQVGNRLNGDRLSTLVDFETLKLAAGAMICSPFIPMLFMGEEYGEENPFLYFVSHGDAGLNEAVKKGRRKEFRDFIKDATPPDPSAESTFNASKLQWDYDKAPKKQQLLNYYTLLLKLRRQLPAMNPENRKNTRAWQHEDKEVILLVREHPDGTLLSAMNFSENEISVSLSEIKHKQAKTLIYSAHEQWGGYINNDHDPLPSENEPQSINISAKSMLLLIFKD